MLQDGTLFPSPKGWDPRTMGWKPVMDFGAIDKAAKKGVAFLLELQGPDGAWGVRQPGGRNAADNDYVRVGVTAIVIDALERHGQGGGEAVKRGYRFIESMAKYDRQAEAYVEAIGKMHSAPGGLAYSYGGRSGKSSTFQLAFLAMSLADAEAAGRKLPDGLLDALSGRLAGSRQDHGGFPYYAGSHEPDEASTAARSVQVEYALAKVKRSSQKDLMAAAERFLLHRDGLRARVAEMDDPSASPHQGPHHWAHYYYLFGNYWTARVLNELQDSDACSMANDMGGSWPNWRAGGVWWTAKGSPARRTGPRPCC